MKRKLTIYSAIIFVVILACRKNNDLSTEFPDTCAEEKHIFDISEETKEWLPDEILNDSLTFESETGKILTLRKDTIYHREHGWTFSKPCENTNKTITIFYERISHRYSSGDTIEISMATNIVNTECGWGNVREVKLMEEVGCHINKWRRNPTKLVNIGALSIRTKLINARDTEQFCTKQFAKFNEQIEINGITYTEVYSDDRPGHENAEFPLAEIYFKKTKGIVGFIDEEGVTWRRIK